jgi:hypothetical protein
MNRRWDDGRQGKEGGKGWDNKGSEGDKEKVAGVMNKTKGNKWTREKHGAWTTSCGSISIHRQTQKIRYVGGARSGWRWAMLLISKANIYTILTVGTVPL